MSADPRRKQNGTHPQQIVNEGDETVTPDDERIRPTPLPEYAHDSETADEAQ
ncbi:hypothetical protein [Actinomadura rupiterrae]|uniref:hypothetical protein n=1 Tax=Actinomadura rupiterrae TaxID=559627 RepID=UPI0020A52F4B|nr:hypothetical protein [Actinomadura rupiterrae]MCP2337558.1 hypothetical protein [Actinomadura rupiterrae]